jgi:hypothetical protein
MRHQMLKLVPPLEELPENVEEFELLGLWQTKDGRLAVVTDLDSYGNLNGHVTRAGRSYTCTWDYNQLSIAPFRFVDDLAIKLEY